MNTPAAAVIMALAATGAAADILCQTERSDVTFAIDLTARTITRNDAAPFAYTYDIAPLRALMGQVVATVPSPIPGLPDGAFQLTFGPGDDVILTEDFTHLLPASDMAFASVEAIMRTVLGIDCAFTG